MGRLDNKVAVVTGGAKGLGAQSGRGQRACSGGRRCAPVRCAPDA